MTKYIKIYGVLVTMLFATIANGQGKKSTLPNYTNPFLKKSQIVSQNPVVPNQNGKVSFLNIVNGSVTSKINKERISLSGLSNKLNSYLNLESKYSFKQITERTDALGFTHTNFQQFYDGFLVEGKLLMVHSKDGLINYVNGQASNSLNFEKIISIPENEAKQNAKDYLKVTDLINDYPVETVITEIPTKNGKNTRLAYRVRIDSYNPFVMCYVYIDVKTGEVLNKINLLAHADTPGSGQTLYSGSQSITCDSHLGGFRLRENSRNIETYNATNASGLTTAGFPGSTDFTSSTTTFSGIPTLNNFSISAVAQSWWYTSFVDVTPDLYFLIKDASNQTVFTSGYYSNTNPPVTYNNLNILLSNPPYTVEIWDYDAGNSDDFGGSYTLTTTAGSHNYTGSGNNGSYTIGNQGNPAADVHWGMEKTYDFYLNVFNRNSYDGIGSVIKQYLNPPTLQSPNGSPNNASAYPAPYNLMQYGMGDGLFMKPVVGLDVEGHEYTHMVVANNGNGGLTYQGESGALNESFADIFGVCVEFYSGVNPDWLMGEDIMVSAPYLRSMSNPNGGQQPDTYGGTFWANPNNLSVDNGGVHINSGVQNFWFYLLCQGGTGTNDISNTYNVTGIGITQAQQIAYRNLTTYLTANATFIDAYYGSLQSAQDLYGNPSTQYDAVRQAWYAVGIGNNPNSYCSGTTNLTAPSGTVTDGSGSANYTNNSNCKWVISPAGATQISLTFTAFDTEANYDSVFVYDGPDETFPVLATWWGNTLPPVITTTSGVGAMCIRFSSDISNTDSGWSANYQAFGNPPSCGGATVLATQTGAFDDGSGTSNYGNNQECYWYIAPPCANSVTLSFSQFNTEANYDGVIVYDDLAGTNQIAVYSGTSIPTAITSNTGKMLVIFVSDYSTNMQGFTANYTSTGSAFCNGTTTLNTSDFGMITDGSGSNNYCSNQDCKWLIQPPQATSITLEFTQFDVEDASTDAQTIYDAVEVYDGTTTSATLLGRFTGNNIPPSITSSGGSLLVYFYSDLEVNKQGWSGNYTSTQNSYCSGSTTLTAPNGSFSDGSSTNNYSNNSNCSWLIQPPNASAINLTFSTFNTELNNDGVIVYDGANNSAPILGQFSGTTIPSSLTSTGGSMYVEFLSNNSDRKQGWTANYSSIAVGIDENYLSNNLKLFPNPNDGIFTIESTIKENGTVSILDLSGKQVLKFYHLNKGTNYINASELSKGVYMLRYDFEESFYVEKLIIR